MRAGYRGTPSWRTPGRRRRNRRLVLGALGLTLLMAGAAAALRPVVWLVERTPLGRVGTIEIAGLKYLSPEEVRARIAFAEGASLLAVDSDSLERLLTSHPRIAEARVKRLLGKLAITVRERETFALVNATRLIEVDATGVILPPLERGLTADRPILSGISLPTKRHGARVTTGRLHDLLRVVSLLELDEVGLVNDISEIVSLERDRAMLRTMHDHIPILVDPERVTSTSLHALGLALRDARARGRRVIQIDTRFRGQVVVRCAPAGAERAESGDRV